MSEGYKFFEQDKTERSEKLQVHARCLPTAKHENAKMRNAKREQGKKGRNKFLYLKLCDCDHLRVCLQNNREHISQLTLQQRQYIMSPLIYDYCQSKYQMCPKCVAGLGLGLLVQTSTAESTGATIESLAPGT